METGTDPITITILGNPASYQKATATWHSKDGRSGTLAYDKKSYANWRSYARGQAADQWGTLPIIEGPVQIRVDIFRPIPSSLSAKKRAAALRGALRPILKPDLSNYLKAVEDACLTGIVIRDDRCIVSARIGKWFSEKPRVEITVEPITEDTSPRIPVRSDQKSLFDVT